MTYAVTDEQLGKIARQQADLFRRVREGSLDVEEVSGKLQDIIEGKPTTGRSSFYSVNVDYGRSVEELVKSGRYDWANKGITSSNFPTRRKGAVEVVVDLINFGRNVSTDKALHEIDKMGYRPVELHELLAFGEKYPDVQREFPIVALGSVWRSPSGGRRVPCLYGGGSGRDLSLYWVEGDWDGVCRFAAVRK